MATNTKKSNLIRLTWVNPAGVVYLTQELTPTAAKRALIRAKVFYCQYSGGPRSLTYLTLAELKRSKKALCYLNSIYGPPAVICEPAEYSVTEG